MLYITDVGANKVYVYSYPYGTLVQTLTGFNSPVRDCSDASGNVYITNTESEEILKFAHGGNKPIATFSDPGYLPWDCSVDPTSGALAATGYGTSRSNTGSVAIFSGGPGPPKIYQDRGVQAYLFCTYDSQGNLFVDGLDHSYGFVLIELRKGASKFDRIAIRQHFAAWGGLQWDGRYLAIGDGSSAIYDFAIKGKKAQRRHVVPLKDAIDVAQFWLDGETLIAPDGPNGANHDAGVWKYPRGGKPVKLIGKKAFQNPSGATVSTVH
ncbi:MAG TPA: hypothetical protein VKE42_10490 [Candidatus Cybelea sp.]|nr:hypothetical protein [Candidatus Cybelea sp.]